ncbi:tyrosine-type recombinase/integrase [Variovorax sp. V59]|uniref:integrase n=1 Tax=unclassified Variovorax TaxID=663243 RepID=UPI0034E8ADF1
MTGKYPRLRSHSRKRASGKVSVYYFYDMRPEGKPDVPLGTDFDAAIKKWDELHNLKPRITGTLEEAFSAWELDEQTGLLSYTNAETCRGYAKSLRQLRPPFGPATWDQVDLPTLKGYLRARSAKTQGNREMALLSVIWNWARIEGMTTLPWPAAGMEKSKWKNPEKPRRMKVLDPVWEAIHYEGNQTLRDCMDLASATGMRLMDCIAVLLPRGDLLHLEASKTGKEAEWDMSLSQTLPDLVQRRRALGADHLMLLSTPEGQPVEIRKLRYQWDKARERAAVKAGIHNDDELVRAIRALYLRDGRKRAAQKSESLEAASQLLQHDSTRLTERHYGAVRRLKPVA